MGNMQEIEYTAYERQLMVTGLGRLDNPDVHALIQKIIKADYIGEDE